MHREHKSPHERIRLAIGLLIYGVNGDLDPEKAAELAVEQLCEALLDLSA